MAAVAHFSQVRTTDGGQKYAPVDLLPCCILMLSQLAEAPAEGHKLVCLVCKESIFHRNGVWRWEYNAEPM